MLKNIFLALLALIALGTSHTILAVDQPPGETLPAQTVPANPDKEAVKQPATNTRPANDTHVDYRYCLELKTNREIAECAYKNR